MPSITPSLNLNPDKKPNNIVEQSPSPHVRHTQIKTLAKHRLKQINPRYIKDLKRRCFMKKNSGLWACRLVSIFLTTYTFNLTFASSSFDDSSIDWKKAPSTATWKRFHDLGLKEKEVLWRKLAAKPVWSGLYWQWRMGWILSCESIPPAQYCEKVLAKGLADSALVVRAKTATTIGKIFSLRPNLQIVRQLEKAYANRSNYRKGDPLYIQYRILYSLFSIGGDQALASGKNLAAQHQKTRKYWANLTSSRF